LLRVFGLFLSSLALLLVIEGAQPRPAQAQGPAICPNTMVSYWRLDETTGSVYEDFYGDNDATCTSGNCPTPVAGQVNGGQQFNGSTTSVNIPASPEFDWGADASFSVELWMKSGAQTCVGTSNDDNEVMIGRTEGRFLHWWLGCRFIEGRATFQLRDRAGNDVTLEGPSITDGQPHHLVAVRDNATKRNLLYVDGTLVDSTVITYTDSFSSSLPLNLGWLNYPGPTAPKYHYSGMLDEVAIYSAPLTADQILEHYNNGLAGQGYCTQSVIQDKKLYLPLIRRVLAQ